MTKPTCLSDSCLTNIYPTLGAELPEKDNSTENSDSRSTQSYKPVSDLFRKRIDSSEYFALDNQ